MAGLTTTDARTSPRPGLGLAGLLVVLCFAAGAALGVTARAGQDGAGAPSGSALSCVVTIPPLKGIVQPMVEAVGGGVTVLVPPGASPHGYEIPPDGVAQIVHADLVVQVGLGVEPAVDRVLRRAGDRAPRTVVFAEVAGIGAKAADDHEADHDDHPADDDHDHDSHEHGGVNPHLWLSPPLVRKLVPAVRDAIADSARAKGLLTDEAKTRLDAAAKDLLRKIDDLDARYRKELAAAPTHTFVTAHDAYAHLAAAYGLTEVPIAGLNAGEPDPSAIARAVKVIREHHLRAIFREPQVGAAACERVAQVTGVKVLVLDPLGDGDWFKMMDANLSALVEGLGGHPPARRE